ncbi:MAG: hypothetical protein JRH11_16525 [Deltaproteobacteria bacterium]|nr:hypothetical protein [Deltaproteobacteria bacterium]
MTPSAGLLWALAFFLAGALAYWDYAQSSPDRAAPQEPTSWDDGPGAAPPVAEDVEIDVIYGS